MPPQVLDEKVLISKSTKELLGRLKRLRACEETFEHSDREESERKNLDKGIIYFKNTAAWKKAYTEVKSILDAREHIGK